MHDPCSNTASMRVAFGEALAEYGAADPRVVVLDADVSRSTQTCEFARRFPERFFNMGIAEPNMVDVAAGLALEGKVAFANTFAFLLALRAAEQIRTQVCMTRANVKLCGAFGGLSDSFDGPSHQSVSDLATMRALPGLTVIVAADASATRKFVPLIGQYPGPVFLRLARGDVPLVFDDSYSPEIGRGVLVRDGSDVSLIASGAVLRRVLCAAESLSGEGISSRVIEIHTLKPFDNDMLERAARETGCIVTVEEHSVIGGLGGAVAEAVSERYPVPLLRVGVRDTFAATGGYDELLDKYGLGVDAIVAMARRVLAMKSGGGVRLPVRG